MIDGQSMIAGRLYRLGLSAIFCMGICGCAATLPHVERVAEHTEKAGADAPLVRAAARAELADGMSGFRPMAQGAVALDARIALIENAQTSIDLQTYLLADDKTGRLILRSLRDAAKRGVTVRLLVDDFYTSGMDPLLLGLAAYPNVEVRLFNPFTTGRDGGYARVATFALDFKRLNHRMHNKLVVVDGVMAIAGGRNTADEYFFRSEQSNFVDFDFLIAGELVNQLGDIFDTYWNSEQVYPVASVAVATGSGADSRAQFDRLVDGSNTPRADVPALPDVFGLPAVSTALNAKSLNFIAAQASAHADSPLKASMTQAQSAEASDTVRKRAMALLPATQSEIIMFSPYFIPGQAGLDAFRAMRERGVQIRLITNSLPTNDEPLVSVGYEYYRVPLLQMGARVYELSSARLANVPTMHKVLGQSKGQLHAKMGFIDRKIVLVGSMNMDPRSANINTELGILVRSPQLATMIIDAYQVDHLQGVYEMKLEADGKTVAWVGEGGEGAEIVNDQPDFNLADRLRLYFQKLFVSDDLL